MIFLDVDQCAVGIGELDVAMLIKGEVDAVIGFDYTIIFNLIEAGLKLEDITLLYFADFGFDFWGNSLIANPAVVESNPDLVRRVAVAVARSWGAAANDRAGAIAAVTKRDGLLKAETERARMVNAPLTRHRVPPEQGE